MKTIDLSQAVWRKSRRSNGQANCVEVATNLPGVVAIRDSKNPEGPKLVVSVQEWGEFVNGLKMGESASNG